MPPAEEMVTPAALVLKEVPRIAAGAIRKHSSSSSSSNSHRHQPPPPPQTLLLRPQRRLRLASPCQREALLPRSRTVR